jgi:hypothetical protein
MTTRTMMPCLMNAPTRPLQKSQSFALHPTCPSLPVSSPAARQQRRRLPAHPPFSPHRLQRHHRRHHLHVIQRLCKARRHHPSPRCVKLHVTLLHLLLPGVPPCALSLHPCSPLARAASAAATTCGKPSKRTSIQSNTFRYAPRRACRPVFLDVADCFAARAWWHPEAAALQDLSRAYHSIYAVCDLLRAACCTAPRALLMLWSRYMLRKHGFEQVPPRCISP